MIVSRCCRSDMNVHSANDFGSFYVCKECGHACDTINRFLGRRNWTMPRFGQESFTKLSTCHLDLQTIFYEVIKTFDCKVLEGHRTQDDQDAAFERGASKLKWPDGKHNHLPSMAIDVAPYPIDWKNIKRFYWFAGFVMGIACRLKEEGKITHSLRFGGDWDSDKDITDQSFNDLVHFELVN